MNNADEFLKELTKLTLKYKLVLCGDGVYYCIKAETATKNLNGKYIWSSNEAENDPSRLEWSDND